VSNILMRHISLGFTVAAVMTFAVSSHSQLNSSHHPLNKAVSSKPPFSVAIVPDASNEHGQWISMWKTSPVAPFYVVLTNITNEPQKVFEAWNDWGYKAISFELLTANGQRVVVSRKDKDFDKNYPSTFIVPAGGHYVYTIQLSNEYWAVTPDLRFANAEPVLVHLKAIYQLTPTREGREAARNNVWIGHVESKSYEYRLVHE